MEFNKKLRNYSLKNRELISHTEVKFTKTITRYCLWHVFNEKSANYV